MNRFRSFHLCLCSRQQILLSLIAATLTYSQPRSISVLEKVKATYEIDSGESLRPIQLSPLGLILLQETIGRNITFSLSQASSSSAKSRIATVATDVQPRAWFSQDGAKVLYRIRKGGRQMVAVYDPFLSTTSELRDEANDVITASISSTTGRIAYRTGDHNVVPLIHVMESYGKKSRQVAEGIGGDWSPNGKWLAILRPRDMTMFRKKLSGDPKVQLKAHPEPTDWVLWIYSPTGESLCQLSEFKNPNEWIWSPASDRILLDLYGVPGFTLVNFNVRGNSVAVSSSRHFAPDTHAVAELRNPSWSPDGKQVAYLRSLLDPTGHAYVKDELWIASVDKNDKAKIYEVSAPATITDLVWCKNGAILLQRDIGSPERTVSIIELSSNDKSFGIRK